jgi:hypothetical protein
VDAHCVSDLFKLAASSTNVEQLALSATEKRRLFRISLLAVPAHAQESGTTGESVRGSRSTARIGATESTGIWPTSLLSSLVRSAFTGTFLQSGRITTNWSYCGDAAASHRATSLRTGDTVARWLIGSGKSRM